MEEERNRAPGIEGYEALLEDYLDARLEGADRARAEELLSTRPEIQQEFESARQASMMLRAVSGVEFQPRPGFWTRTQAQLRSADRERRFWIPLERLAWRLSFGAALAVVALVGYLAVARPALPPASAQTEVTEIFLVPIEQPENPQDELLLTVGGNANGR